MWAVYVCDLKTRFTDISLCLMFLSIPMHNSVDYKCLAVSSGVLLVEKESPSEQKVMIVR